MATADEVLAAFRDHMVAAGIVRVPSGGPVAARPPMFVEPEDGPLSPGELKKPEENDAGLVVSIFYGGAVAAGDDAYRSRATIDVRLRSKGTAGFRRAMAVAADLRAELFEPGDPSPGISRQGWVMAGVPVIRSGEWGALSRIGSTRDGGYDHVWKAYIEHYA